jgi:DNA-directed RNA polymerase specialized sigma24 family protein
MATPALMADVLELKERFPRATTARIAGDLGVSVGTVNAWIQHALRRRGEQRLRGGT